MVKHSVGIAIKIQQQATGLITTADVISQINLETEWPPAKKNENDHDGDQTNLFRIQKIMI
jgi:hypothetical protein